MARTACWAAAAAVIVADGDLVVAFSELGERRGRVGYLVVVGDDGHGAVVAHDPVAVVVLGPVGNLVPVAGLVLEGHALGLGRGAPLLAHVADVLGAVGALLLEHGNLLGGGHVLVSLRDAVLLLDVVPGADPVGPGVRHAHGVDLALLLGLGDDVVQGHGVVVHGLRGGGGAVLAAGEAQAGAAGDACETEHAEERPARHGVRVGDAVLHKSSPHL